jgi:DNA-directed RNA polymerase sigma subunit (sigma70/sigma32)
MKESLSSEIEAAISSLSDKEQSLIKKKYFASSNLSEKTICKQCGIPTNMMKEVEASALQKIKNHISKTKCGQQIQNNIDELMG